ncbi:MAG: ECF transporter S component [Alkaliphilus sp.]
MFKQIQSKINKIMSRWSTRDLLVLAVISIVFAVLMVAMSYMFIAIIRPLGLLARTAFQGLWFIPAIFMGYTIRKPGSVLISQLMIRLITVAFSPYGWMELVGLVVVGIPIELVFSAYGYKNYKIKVLLLAGISAGVIRTIVAWIPYGLSLLAPNLQVLVVGLTIASGIFAALIAKVFADAIAKTGVLNNYLVGREQQEEI